MRKNKNIFESMKYAIKGFYNGFKSERNIKNFTIIIIVMLFLNIDLFQLQNWKIAVHFITGICTLAAECTNSVVEMLCDKFIRDKDKDIENIKDLAAAPVMLLGYSYIILEIIFLLF